MPGLLLIVAHPDDEFFCSGAIAALRHNNVEVGVVCWTRGEGGMGKRRRQVLSLLPAVFNPRVWEMKKSMRALGVLNWSFLDYVDPAPNPSLQAPQHDSSVFQSELEKLMDHLKPQVVMTHGSDGEYGHPAHLVLHQRVREVLQNRRSPIGLITFLALRPDKVMERLQNQSDPADVLLDAQPYARERLGVVLAHSSQQKVWPPLFPEAEGSLEKVIEISRSEYYRCWESPGLLSKDETMKIFCGWSGASHLL